MSENFILGILTIIVSVVGSSALVEWRLKSLEKKVDIHNGYAEKFANITTDIKLLQADMEYIKKSIDKIKSKIDRD